MTETVVPQGRGKSAAMAEFLSGGGGLRLATKRGGYRYTDGRLKGKTQDEAVSVFERLWAGASPAIKDKYARRESAEGVLAPSEMAEYDDDQLNRDLINGEGPEAGVEYGDQRKVAGIRPTPATNALPVAATANATTTGTTNTAPMGAEARRMKFYSDQKANRQAYYAPPQAQKQSSTTPAAMKTQATPVPNSMQAGSSKFVGPPSPTQATATTARTQDRMVSNRPSILGGVVNSVREAFGGEKAPVPVPDGSVPGAPVRINRLTGLPFGYRPGDALPTGADGTMKDAATASLARQTEASALAGQGQPFRGITASQPATADRPMGYAGPKTRYTPGMGEVPVATPVKTGEEQISYDQYQKAKSAPRGTTDTTQQQDNQNVAIGMEFERQAQARRKLPGGSLSGDYAKRRLVTR